MLLRRRYRDDVAAGLAAGVTTIAMTAGYTSPDLLKAANPHAAVGDLRDLIK
jgi:phosphoglycolate phosphatase-like HAD superfamily hydrolase